MLWLFNSLAAVVRGTGNMALPAKVTLAGVVIVVPLSPLPIFSAGPVPALGIAGGAVALLAYCLFATPALGLWLGARHSLFKPAICDARLRWALFKDILRVGLLGVVSILGTNRSIGIATALAGRFGAGAIAGYGTGARLEYLLVPLVFGLGAPLLVVGIAGNRKRATWAGAGIAVVLTEAIGMLAAGAPERWLLLFGNEPAMLAARSHCLRLVGPCCGLFGVGLVLYFASQSTGRLFWPVFGHFVLLAIAGGGGWLCSGAGK